MFTSNIVSFAGSSLWLGNWVLLRWIGGHTGPSDSYGGVDASDWSSNGDCGIHLSHQASQIGGMRPDALERRAPRSGRSWFSRSWP